MDKKIVAKLNSRLDEKEYEKLININNSYLHQFIGQYIERCNPDTVFICNDSPEDYDYIRESALKNREEIQLSIPGHTAHLTVSMTRRGIEKTPQSCSKKALTSVP